MTSIALNAKYAANENFSAQRSLKDTIYEKMVTLRDKIYEKMVALRDKIRENHFQIFMSQKAAKDGNPLNGTGKILRGVPNRNGNDEDAFFANSRWGFAFVMLSQPIIRSWSGIQDLFNSALKASTALSPSYAQAHPQATPLSYSFNHGQTQSISISNTFLNAIDTYKVETIRNTEVNAESAFNAINKGYKLPFRAHITDAYNAAHGNEAIAKHNLKTIMLEQKGLCFSKGHHRDHIISMDQLEKLREAFIEKNGDIDTIEGKNTIHVFSKATLNTAPAFPHPTPALRTPTVCFAA